MSGFSGNVDEPGDDHAGHGMLLLGAGVGAVLFGMGSTMLCPLAGPLAVLLGAWVALGGYREVGAASAARRDPTRAIFTLILGAIGLVTGLTGTLVAVLYCSIFSLMFSFVGLSALLGL